MSKVYKKKKNAKTGAYLLLNSLIENGVEHIFGYPGGAILPIYDELFYWEKEGLIKHILVRHEQSAAHAADAYSRTTNKVGVCFATSGPGATNLVTGIATAKMDSIPLVIITGQVARSFLGTDAFQEIDIFNITLPIVKESYKIKKAADIPALVHRAFSVAKNGRPGPVLLDFPKDVGLEEVEKSLELYFLKEEEQKEGSRKILLKKYINSLKNSYQSLGYIGGGSISSNATKSLKFFSKIFQTPLCTTLMGKGSINEKDYLSLGMLGMHGTAYANFAVSECDLLLSIGARFDDRVTGKLEEFACEATILHIDIDRKEISKNKCPQISCLGDVRKTVQELLKEVKKEEKRNTNSKEVKKNWLQRIQNWKKVYPIYSQSSFDENDSTLSPQDAIYHIGKEYCSSTFTTDVGQHQMWSAQLVNTHPKNWASSSGLGTMGFGLPAALGAQVAKSHQETICITGDSSFQMSIQELGTISQYKLNTKIFIINNHWQGMVRQWQESFYGNRFSNSYMKNGMPNFLEIAKAYSIHGKIVSTKKELIQTLKEIKDSEEPYLIEILVKEQENCYPMVIPGRNNSHMFGIKK